MAILFGILPADILKCALPIAGRRQTIAFSKHPRKIVWTCVSYSIRDLRNRTIAVPQETLRLMQTQLVEKGDEGHPVLIMENPGKMASAQLEMRRD